MTSSTDEGGFAIMTKDFWENWNLFNAWNNSVANMKCSPVLSSPSQSGSSAIFFARSWSWWSGGFAGDDDMSKVEVMAIPDIGDIDEEPNPEVSVELRTFSRTFSELGRFATFFNVLSILSKAWDWRIIDSHNCRKIMHWKLDMFTIKSSILKFPPSIWTLSRRQLAFECRFFTASGDSDR